MKRNRTKIIVKIIKTKLIVKKDLKSLNKKIKIKRSINEKFLLKIFKKKREKSQNLVRTISFWKSSEKKANKSKKQFNNLDSTV